MPAIPLNWPTPIAHAIGNLDAQRADKIAPGAEEPEVANYDAFRESGPTSYATALGQAIHTLVVEAGWGTARGSRVAGNAAAA